jgi:hypothetical protein
MRSFPCRTAHGREFEILIPPQNTVADLKALIQAQLTLPPGTLKLVMNSQFLSDATVIKDIRLASDSRVMVHSTVPRRAPRPAPHIEPARFQPSVPAPGSRSSKLSTKKSV